MPNPSANYAKTSSHAGREPPLNQRYGRLLSCSLPCSGLSFEAFLAAADGQERFYWASPAGALAFAGMGAAVELSAWGDDRYRKIAADARELFADACIEGAADALAGPRLFGGFAFRGDFTPDNTWSIYAPAFFVLPHYQLARSDGQMWLTINAQIPPDESPPRLIPELMAALSAKAAQLRAASTPAEPTSELHGIDYPMSYSRWQRMIEAATERIRAGELNKIVLARAAELRFVERVQLLPVLHHLAAHYAECYRFLFEPRPRFAFYGASPELLASVQGAQFSTMALAGSIGRGADEAQDRQLSQALRNSPKDRHEHQIVVDKMRDRLRPLAESLEIAPRELLVLSNIQHLQTPLAGRLKRADGVLPLVEALHPTPALGGDPRPRALRLIRQLEPIPRGWYGAPVGLIDSRLEGEFAVAIRSAVAQETRVWVYAGAGIVADSLPRPEWDETELKFQPMLDAHGA
ncbi:MAG: isochorismate synthase [Chloroflexi bacterium]|nr:isochorismate synthase [Chloroflexota bacterium]